MGTAPVSPRQIPSALVSVPTAANELGLSSSTIRRWLREGRLVAVRFPTGTVRVSRDDLEALKARGQD